MNKVDYKKEYKDLYMPKSKPTIITVPEMSFITVLGEGDPNTSKEYENAMEALYGLSFTIKMSKMGSRKIDGYFEYVVPPLEGLWSFVDTSKTYSVLDKDNFKWKTMIRQPEFVTEEIFNWAREELKKKKPTIDFSKVNFETFAEGLCVQMMHIGSYDDEPASFKIINQFVAENGYGHVMVDDWHHHEIYLTDPRKCAAEKNKTVLRYNIEKI